MLRKVIRFGQKIKRAVVRAVTALVRRVSTKAGTAWTAHARRASSDPMYVAVVSVLHAAAVGVIPVKEMVAALLAAAIEIFINGHYQADRPTGRDTNTWHIDPDAA